MDIDSQLDRPLQGGGRGSRGGRAANGGKREFDNNDGRPDGYLGGHRKEAEHKRSRRADSVRRLICDELSIVLHWC